MGWDAGHQLRLACMVVGLLFALGVGACGGEEEQPAVSSTQLPIGGDPTPPEDSGDFSTTGEGEARGDSAREDVQAVGGRSTPRDHSGSGDVAEPVALPEPPAVSGPLPEPTAGPRPTLPEPAADPPLDLPEPPPPPAEGELESPGVDVSPVPPGDSSPPVERPGRPDPCDDPAGSQGLLSPAEELIGRPSSCGEQAGLLHDLLEPVVELLPPPLDREVR